MTRADCSELATAASLRLVHGLVEVVRNRNARKLHGILLLTCLHIDVQAYVQPAEYDTIEAQPHEIVNKPSCRTISIH